MKNDSYWKAVETVLRKGLELPESERTAFLQKIDASNTVKAEVRALLDADEQSDDQEQLDRPSHSRVDESQSPHLRDRNSSQPGSATNADPNATEPIGDQHYPTHYSEFGAGESKSVNSASYFGDYEIIREIARGGMGVVYKARQVSLNRTVALKKVLTGHLAGEEDVKRFQLEAEASANLDHPGIVPVYDFGEHDGQHYFSMGFVEGESLSEKLADGPLPPRNAAELLVKISRAVAYANEKGVVHRDIKPGNILLDENGEPRVTDFGLAKRHHDDSGITATGQILGTPSFMPPEQASGKADLVDQRADVYALGAILYATLAGRPPFQAAHPMETLNQVMETEPVSLRLFVPTVPRDLETICLKCLRKEANRRYETGNDLADDLQRWLGGEPIVARRVSRTERVWKWCKRKPVVVVSIATIATLLVVGSFIFWERQNASYADGLVSSLINADVTQVPSLTEELGAYRWWAEPRLRVQLLTTRVGSIEELHLSWALLENDPEQATKLLAHLPTATPAYVELIRNGLSDYSSPEMVDSFWQVALDSSASNSSRLNAACVLAELSPEDDRWEGVEDEVTLFLVESLSRSPRDYDVLVAMLAPLRITLAQPLGRIVRDPALSDLQRQSALNVLIEYAFDQPSVLCDVAMDVEAAAFEQLLSLIKPQTEQSVPLFVREIERSLNDINDPLEKESIGRRQANAAIALLCLSQDEAALSLLERRIDPRAGTWFIDRLNAYSIPSGALRTRLDLKAFDKDALSVQMGILQSLGGLTETQFPTAERDKLIPELLEAYRDHPDPGLHGSLAWLLRQWNASERLEAVDSELQQDSLSKIRHGANGKRGWYVNSLGQTMVILEAGEFKMGTAQNSDPDAYPDEIYHLRRIDRTIAIASTEVTKSQFREFKKDNPGTVGPDQPNLAHFLRTEDSPMSVMSWYDAAWYCNWLSDREGLPEEEWCYETNRDGSYGPGMRIKENFWELDGYRLPTEAEWEFACRAESDTRFSYGYAESLLPRYARFETNGEGHQWPVGFTLPNAFGLFDMYGNVLEWCQDDRDPEYSVAERIEQEGKLVTIIDNSNWPPVSDSKGRVLRGGSFVDTVNNVRSSYRNFATPGTRSTGLGFRVARTYHSLP